MKKVAFKTLGCRLNQFETDSLVTQFANGGYQIVKFGEEADITIINTCTVTNQSDQKSRNYINQAAKINPDGLTVVAGCMVNNRVKDLEKQPDISVFVKNETKSNLFHLIDARVKGEIINQEELEMDVFAFETVKTSLHTRTFIKIQDGCDNFCSYCIIPKVRGRAVSRPVNDIVDNVKRLIDNDFKELVLTGVNISRYHYNEISFSDLIEKILNIEGDFRIRISSIEPDHFHPDFPQLFQHPKLNPHLHLCLQSGSDKILMQMRRMYDVKSFMQIIDSFRKVIPDFNFTTDIIVGFPGESDADFQKTCDIAREAAFSHIHTFRYSLRKGTRAARFENQIPEKVKVYRSKIIRNISDMNEQAYFQSMIGKNQNILIENPSPGGKINGYGENYLPVKINSPKLQKNTIIPVYLEKLAGNDQLVFSGTMI